MTYYKATRTDGTSFYDSKTKWTVGRSGEICEKGLGLVVVRDDPPTLPHVARSARQRHVLHGCISTLRRRNQVVEVEHPAVSVEELENPTLRYCRRRGTDTAMATDAPVTLGDGVADSRWNVAGVSHAPILAPGDASGDTPFDRLYGPWASVMERAVS